MTRIETAEIWIERSALVRKLARALVADPHEAEDLAHDAVLAALRGGPSAPVPWRSWITGVLRNLARARRRDEGRRDAREQASAQRESVLDENGLLEHLEIHHRLIAAVRELDEPYRSTLLLRYFEELSPSEIARRTRTPVRTVHTRLSRGLEKLRARLDRGHGGRDRWIALLAPLVGRPAAGVLGALGMHIKLKVTIAAVLMGTMFYAVWRTASVPAEEAAVTDHGPAAPSTPAVGASSGPERARTRATDPPETAASRRPVDSAAATGRVLEVLVVDATSESPVSGASVTWFDLDWYARALDEADTTVDTPEGRELRARDARTVWTGEDGTADIELIGRRHWLEASAGDRWEFALLDDARLEEAAAEGPFTVRIEKDRSVCIRVVDPEGRPLADVPVLLRRPKSPGGSYDWKLTESEAPDGRARFEHFQRRLRQGDGWRFAFGFPVPGDPELPALVTDCDGSPLLTLPGAGSVVVHVDDLDSSEDRSDLRLSLAVLDPRTGAEIPRWSHAPWSRARLGPNGTGRVLRTGLGLRLRIDLLLEEEPIASAEIDGPARQAEVVECRLRVAPPRLVTGRIVLADGRPWPPGRITVEPLAEPGRSKVGPLRDVRIEDEGRFRLALRDTSEERAEARGVRCRLEGETPDGTGLAIGYVALEFDASGAGIDLGDVVLDIGPLLVSGRIVDEQGSAVAGASVHLSARTGFTSDARWRPVAACGKVSTNADGIFSLHLAGGLPEPADVLRVWASAPGFPESAPLECRRGDSGLAIVLARGGRIAGSLDAATGDPADVFLMLHGAGLGTNLIVTDGKFESGPLPPGAYVLAIHRLRANGRPEAKPLRSVDDVIVVAGETSRDARLQRIDLGGPLESIALTVVDRSNAPVAAATAVVAGVPEFAVFLAGDDGVCHVRTARLPVDLLVGAFGYRERRVGGLGTDARVVLDEGIAVRLRVGAPPACATPYRLLSYVHRVDPSGARRELVYRDSFPDERRAFDAGGELRLRMPGPGTYECALSVSVVTAEQVGSGAQVELDPPLRFTVADQDAEQVFDLGVAPEALARAVERANGVRPKESR